MKLDGARWDVECGVLEECQAEKIFIWDEGKIVGHHEVYPIVVSLK